MFYHFFIAFLKKFRKASELSLQPATRIWKQEGEWEQEIEKVYVKNASSRSPYHIQRIPNRRRWGDLYGQLLIEKI